MFCETRQFAEEWTYRYLAAARRWAQTEADAPSRIPAGGTELDAAPDAPEPSTAEVRRWALTAGLPVSDRGRLRPEIWQAWRDAHRG